MAEDLVRNRKALHDYHVIDTWEAGIALLGTEGVELTFTRGAISEIARIASEANERAENIGARRLHTILTILLEDYLFQLPDLELKAIRIDKRTVQERLREVIADEDLSRYVL